MRHISYTKNACVRNLPPKTDQVLCIFDSRLAYVPCAICIMYTKCIWFEICPKNVTNCRVSLYHGYHMHHVQHVSNISRASMLTNLLVIVSRLNSMTRSCASFMFVWTIGISHGIVRCTLAILGTRCIRPQAPSPHTRAAVSLPMEERRGERDWRCIPSGEEVAEYARRWNCPPGQEPSVFHWIQVQESRWPLTTV